MRVATAIRARCDIVANQLLNRVRHDAIERAEAAVKTAMAQLSARQASLELFRNARMQIDPLPWRGLWARRSRHCGAVSSALK